MRMKYFVCAALFVFGVFTAVFAQTVTVYSAQESLGKGINTPYYEENPVLHPSGSLIYFTRSRHPGNIGGKADKGDIWMSEQAADGSWSAAVNAGVPLNNNALNAILGFADNGAEMYLSVEYKDKDKITRKGVAVSRQTGKGWSEPRLADIQYFSNKSDHQSGWVTNDGTVMMLAIEAPGGYGTEDLYVCFRQPDGSWSSPRNLGFMINTAYQEMTPFLAEDKKTLIFATNGIAGQGSRDLFMSVRQDDSWRNWSAPVSLSNKVNTAGTELSFSFRPGDDYAYLTSTQDSEGYGDIKRVRITADIVAQALDSIPQTPLIGARAPAAADPEMVAEQVAEAPAQVIVEGIVRNAKTLQPVQATITVTGASANSRQITADGSGEFSLQLEPEQSFTLVVTAAGFLEEQLVVETFDNAGGSETIMLQPLAVGNTVPLSHVLFEQSTANIIKGSEADLDRVANMMKQNPGIEILISGHTDNQGPIKPNIELSENRVQTVIDYLVAQGIDKSRLSGKGFGPTKPIASNASEETRKLNRRVEFTIIKND